MAQGRRTGGNKKRRITRSDPASRLILMFIVFMVTLSIVSFVRMFYIIYVHGDEYEARAINNQVSRVQDKTINANRGNIYDRNNQPLAVSNTVYTVVLDVRVLMSDDVKQEARDETIEGLSRLLDMPESSLNKYLEKNADGTLVYNTNWQVIAKQVPYDVGKQIEAEGLTCVYLEEDTLRSYPNDKAAPQTIGFIRGEAKWGLEAYYDDEMTGTPGRVFRTYEADDSVVTRREDPIRGHSLVTTLDLTLQQYADNIAKTSYDEYEAQNTSVLVMNPNTGELLASASYPTFSLNDPTKISQMEDEEFAENWDNLSEEEQSAEYVRAWKNYNVTSTFEPGSIMKPIVVASALEEGSINESDSFFCGGKKVVDQYEIHCHNKYGHGTQTIPQVLAHSCNVGMMDIAYAMGREKFYKHFKDFGFGELTGIDLPNEANAEKLIYTEDQLNITELSTCSFGQGFNCTPIQILTAFSALINGGYLMKPYVVSQILDADGNVIKENEPTVVRRVISQDTSDWMRTTLEEVINGDGTGTKARIEGYAIGGKTGTAEQGKRGGDLWVCDFIAYLPIENPNLICMVTIDRPVGGDSVSPAPQMRELLIDLINTYNISPSDENVDYEVLGEAGEITLDDYTGYSLENAMTQLNELGIDYEIVGDSGDSVLKQFPVGGTTIDSSTKVLLYITIGDNNSSLVPVPDFMGLSLEQAQQAADAYGFELLIDNSNTELENASTAEAPKSTEQTSVSSDGDSGENEKETETVTEAAEDSKEEGVKVVYSQAPSAGSKVPSGATVKIKMK